MIKPHVVAAALVVVLVAAGGACCLLPLAGVTHCDNAYAYPQWQGNEVVRLPFRASWRTPAGMAVDGPQAPGLGEHLDAAAQRVGDCLAAHGARMGPVRHCGLRVKLVAPDHPRGTFKCGTGDCWGAVQSPGTVVLPIGNLGALEHELAHVLLGLLTEGQEVAACSLHQPQLSGPIVNTHSGLCGGVRCDRDEACLDARCVVQWQPL